MRTGWTGTPASRAAWKTARRKYPCARPHQVLPSGNTTIVDPSRRVSAIRSTVRGSARSRSRSMNSAPLLAVSAPATGHCRISALAIIRPGRTAASSGMSIQEMWLATTSRPPAGGVSPVIRSRTPAARTMVRHQVLMSRSRGAAGIRPTTGISTIPKVSTDRRVASRSSARGTPAIDPVDSRQRRGVHGALGSQALVGVWTGRNATGRTPARRGDGTFVVVAGKAAVATPGLTSAAVSRRGRSITPTRDARMTPLRVAPVTPVREAFIRPVRARGSAGDSAG